MTLRLRLALIVSLVAAVALAVDAGLVVSEYTFSVSQADRQLLAFQKQSSKVVKYVDAGGVLSRVSMSTAMPTVTPKPNKSQGSQGAKSSQAEDTSENITKEPVVPNAFIGLVSNGSTLSPYAFEAEFGTQPSLIGVTLPSDSGPIFSTLPTDASTGGFMRVMLVRQGQDTLVVGIALDSILAASVQLATNAAIGWLVILTALLVAYFWVSRLGLGPIRRVAQVARRISAGDKTQRVPDFPSDTEAQDLGIAVNDLLDENNRVESNLRRFVSDAAHELRTPMTAISGYSALYGRGLLPKEEDVADAMRRIHEEASRMTRLVNDLLALTTADAPARLENFSMTDVVPIVDAVLGDMRVIDAHRTFERLGADQAFVFADQDKLTQLLVILLTNACDHSPEQSQIEVHVSFDASTRIAVTNVGSLVPSEDSTRVFERFARVDESRQRRSGGGTGLGLAIAKALVSSLGGQIHLESMPMQEGMARTTVAIELPNAQPPADQLGIS